MSPLQQQSDLIRETVWTRSAPLLAAVPLAAALFAGCGSDPEVNPDRQAYLAAVELQNVGRYAEALDEYQRLGRGSDDREIRAKADLCAARIRVAFDRRDRAVARLGKLATMADRLPLDTIDEQISNILSGFQDTPFQQEVHDAGTAARLAAKERRNKIRELQTGALTELIERGEYSGALEYLRQVEAKRPATDRNDIPALLEQVRVASEADVERFLDRLGGEFKRDPEAALDRLEQQLNRFAGTTARRRLLQWRDERAGKAPATRESGATSGAADDRP